MEELSFENGRQQENSYAISSKPSKSLIILVSIIIIFAVFVVVAIVVGLNTKSNDKISVSGCYIESSYTEYLGYSASIKGSAKNVTNRNFSYVQLEFAVYDASNSNLGTAIANINNLGAGENWNFEATLFSFPSTKPVSFKLVDITTW